MRVELKLCTLKENANYTSWEERKKDGWVCRGQAKSDQTHEWNSNVSRQKVSARHLNHSPYSAGCEGEEQASHHLFIQPELEKKCKPMSLKGSSLLPLVW